MRTQLAVSIFALLALLVAPAVAGAEEQGELTALEAEILAETNRARQNPSAYASKLEQRLATYRGKNYRRADGTTVRTREGKRAVREAIGYLNGAASSAPLLRVAGMDAAAADHARDQGRAGRIGHEGSDGSQPHERVSRHGRWRQVTGENIYYGGATAEDIVIGFIVDDGVRDRGHRTALFHPEFAVTGVSCQPHASDFELVCVIEYAAAFEATVLTAQAR